jgi:hypothetical protein
MIYLPGRRYGKIQSERCKSEMESNWRGVDRSAQQNQVLVQARWNGKATTIWLNITFVWGEKSNGIVKQWR